MGAFIPLRGNVAVFCRTHNGWKSVQDADGGFLPPRLVVRLSCGCKYDVTKNSQGAYGMERAT